MGPSTRPGAPEPASDSVRALVAEQLAQQSRVCASQGSRLYERLLAAAADDVARGGPCWALCAGDARPGYGEAKALRLMAAVHRLVLTGRLPELEPFYPSVGGHGDADAAVPVFLEALETHQESVRALIDEPCQTNEVGRASALVGGFLEVARRTGLPLRLLEVGASGGLNLCWDRFRFGGGGASLGPDDSPVDLRGMWEAPPPALGARVEVASRHGCDPNPVDPATREGRLILKSAVWADQTARLARLDGACDLAAELRPPVDRARAAAWTAERLAEAADGVATVVFHSVVEDYLDDEERARFRRGVEEAGARAAASAPLAWLRLEPSDELRRHELTLARWPGGGGREALGGCGPHGGQTRWRASDDGA